MDLHDRREEVITFQKQTSFSPLILSIGDHNAKDGLACGPDHGLDACGHLDVSRLQSVGTSSICDRFAF